MAETLRELVVALSLDSSNFSRNMRTINQQIKEAESTFRLAGAGVQNYEKTIAGTEAKLSMLGQKLTQQQRAVEQYSRALVAANDKLKGRYGFLSSSVLWKDGTTCVMNRQLLHQKMHDFIESPDPGVKRSDQATFVSLLFPASVIKKVGLPIKEYFIWGDDVEFTRRIAVIHKYPCFYIGKSRVVHMMNNNAGSSIAFDDIARLDRYVYAFRNDGCTYRREGMKGRIWYIGKCGINACRILAKSKDHKRERLGTLIQGMKESAKFHPAIEYLLNI